MMLYIFQFFNRIIYSLIPPRIISFIAYSRIGKMYALLFKYKGLAVFETTSNIKLELSYLEAKSLGVLYLGDFGITESEFIRSRLNPCGVFFDIGAYVDGWYSMIAQQIVSTTGKVYAFEPIPEYVKRLKKQYVINNVKNIKIIEKAVHDQDNTLEMLEMNEGEFMSLEEYSSYKASKKNKIKVQTISLDTFCLQEKLKKVDFIKIDVDYHELQVLHGAKRILSTMLDLELLVEVHKEVQMPVIQFMHSLGYKTYAFWKNKLVLYDLAHSDYDDLFFTRKTL
ncbi:MAG: FkbM family methyltransferase [Candidatus Roizmanbacteria bacterium]